MYVFWYLCNKVFLHILDEILQALDQPSSLEFLQPWHFKLVQDIIRCTVNNSGLRWEKYMLRKSEKHALKEYPGLRSSTISVVTSLALIVSDCSPTLEQFCSISMVRVCKRLKTVWPSPLAIDPLAKIFSHAILSLRTLVDLVFMFGSINQQFSEVPLRKYKSVLYKLGFDINCRSVDSRVKFSS